MGWLSKAFKKVGGGVKKAFKKVGSALNKVWQNKWARIAIIGATVFFGGAALMGAAGLGAGATVGGATAGGGWAGAAAGAASPLSTWGAGLTAAGEAIGIGGAATESAAATTATGTGLPGSFSSQALLPGAGTAGGTTGASTTASSGLLGGYAPHLAIAGGTALSGAMQSRSQEKQAKDERNYNEYIRSQDNYFGVNRDGSGAPSSDQVPNADRYFTNNDPRAPVNSQGFNYQPPSYKPVNRPRKQNGLLQLPTQRFGQYA